MCGAATDAVWPFARDPLRTLVFEDAGPIGLEMFLGVLRPEVEGMTARSGVRSALTIPRLGTSFWFVIGRLSGAKYAEPVVLNCPGLGAREPRIIAPTFNNAAHVERRGKIQIFEIHHDQRKCQLPRLFVTQNLIVDQRVKEFVCCQNVACPQSVCHCLPD